MRKLFIIPLFFFSISLLAQNLTGTWRGVYYGNKNANTRTYYYRFYLQEKSDSIFGLGEALMEDFDIETMDDEFSRAVYKFTVKGKPPDPNDSLMELYTHAIVEKNIYLIPNETAPPYLLRFDCTITQSEDSFAHDISFSSKPDFDSLVGAFNIKKISDDLPVNLDEYFYASHREKINLIALLKQKLRKKEPAKDKTSAVYRSKVDERANDVQKILEIKSNHVQIDLYDNGIIDNDTVTVYLDNVIIADSKRLSDKPIHLELNLDQEKDYEIKLYANNLGDIPPNTALAIIKAEGVRYYLSLTGTLEKNAVLILRRKSAEPE